MRNLPEPSVKRLYDACDGASNNVTSHFVARCDSHRSVASRHVIQLETGRNDHKGDFVVFD